MSRLSEVRLAARMLAGFLVGICADSCFGWLSYAPADRTSLRRQRTVVAGLGLFLALVVFVGTGQPKVALLPLGATLAVLSILEFSRWVHGRLPASEPAGPADSPSDERT